MSTLPLDAFDDPVPNPYPEFEGEVFEGYLAQGLTPADFNSEEAGKFAAWMDAQGLVQVVAQKSNPYHDGNGEFTSKENAIWKKTGSKQGSNPGGTYEANGEKHYVKFPNNPGQIDAEVAADKYHEMLGVETMSHQVVQVNGKRASASAWKDIKQLGSAGWKNLNDSQVQEAANAFVASALVKNWDVVGMTHDNMGTTKAGRIAIMDTGGSFEYRAQGEHKNFDGDATSEIKGMLSPEKTSGRVYAPLMAAHKEKFVKAAEKLKSFSDVQLLAPVAGMDSKIGKALLQRRDSILKYFNLS